MWEQENSSLGRKMYNMGNSCSLGMWKLFSSHSRLKGWIVLLKHTGRQTPTPEPEGPATHCLNCPMNRDHDFGTWTESFTSFPYAALLLELTHSPSLPPSSNLFAENLRCPKIMPFSLLDHNETAEVTVYENPVDAIVREREALIKNHLCLPSKLKGVQEKKKNSPLLSCLLSACTGDETESSVKVKVGRASFRSLPLFSPPLSAHQCKELDDVWVFFRKLKVTWKVACLLHLKSSHLLLAASLQMEVVIESPGEEAWFF